MQQGVEAGGGLVEDQQLRVAGERLHDPDLAAVPGAQLPDRPGRVEVEPIQQPADVGLVEAAAQGAEERDGLGDGVPGIEVQLRREEPDAGADRRVTWRATQHLGSTRRRAQDVEQQTDRRRLARPVRAEEPEDFAGHDLEIEAVDGDEAVEALGQASGGDDGLNAQGSSSRRSAQRRTAADLRRREVRRVGSASP